MTSTDTGYLHGITARAHMGIMPLPRVAIAATFANRDLSTTPDFRRRRSSVPRESDQGREGTVTPQHAGVPMSGRELFRQLNHAR